MTEFLRNPWPTDSDYMSPRSSPFVPDDYRLYHESCDEIVDSADGMGSSGSSHQYHDLKINFFRVVRPGIVHPLKLVLMHLITSRILCGGGGSKSLNSVTVMMIWSVWWFAIFISLAAIDSWSFSIIRTNVSARRSIIWGISLHSRYTNGEVLFFFVVYI